MKIGIECRICGIRKVVNGQMGVDRYRLAHLHNDASANKTGCNIKMFTPHQPISKQYAQLLKQTGGVR